VRVYLDIVDRQGELFALVTVPGGLRGERPVAWAGEPGRRLLVARGTASAVPDPAGLAAAADQGNASGEELNRYGGLLFEAAFGQHFWQQLVEAAIGERRLAGPAHALPYLELAVRGRAAGDHAGLQALRWEALHDGTRAVAVQGTARDNGADGETDEVSVGIVRLVPGDKFPEAGTDDAASATADLLITQIPRVLFAVGSPLTDPGVRPAAELMGIMHDLDRDGGSIHPKILDSATITSYVRSRQGGDARAVLTSVREAIAPHVPAQVLDDIVLFLNAARYQS
jgi:hypothetical protein